MILTRSPLRISIGGGGTDLPSFYEHNGTQFSSLAIDKFVYVSVFKRFYKNHLIKYRITEEVENYKQIKNEIIREIFKQYYPDDSSIEFTTMADVPAGTGLGSSGAFTVAGLAAVRKMKNLGIDPFTLAKEATKIEMINLERNIGLQDQFASSFGGFNVFDVEKNGQVTVNNVRLETNTQEFINSNMQLFFVGTTRDASNILKKDSKEMKNNLSKFAAIMERGKKITRLMIEGNMNDLGKEMHEHWMEKRERQKEHTDSKINLAYDDAMKNGAFGGKLVGAGGSGFILLLSDNTKKITSVMDKHGMPELEFKISHNGYEILTEG